jgi:hypothetical protein
LKIKNCKLHALILLATCCQLLAANTAFADVVQTQSIPVSAFVGPQPGAYQLNLVQQDGTTSVTNGKYYAYTITYGAQQSAKFNTANTIITFDWSKALAPNGQNMFDYVYGSANNAYGGVKPVVDTGNKTITWTIPNLPPGTTDQKLVFQLFTNSYDKTTTAFPLDLTASMTNEYLTLPDQTLTVYYQYQAPPPGPSATPTPQPTATPPPPPPPPPLYTVGITGISQNNANVSITTRYPSKLSVSYGTTPTNFTHTFSSNENTYQHPITLSNLWPDTQYYFTFTITSMWGYSTSSEIYTFRTAKPSQAPSIDNNIIVIADNGNIYFSETQQQAANSHASVILTVNNNYDISYTLTNPTQVKSIETVLLNKILGNNTLAAIELPTEMNILMKKRQPNLYVTALQTLTTGLYELNMHVTDINGNIVEKKIADIKVIPRFTVYAKDTGAPLQDARVFLYYFDSQTQRYLPLSQQLFGNSKNPGYTDATGQLAVTLPAGKYQAEESALLYNKVTTDFTIGPGINQNYPVIYLQRDPTNLAALVTFSGNYITDSWNKLIVTLQSYSSSIRLFHLFAVAILSSFVFVNFLLFSIRSQIKAHHLPVFFLFHVNKMLNRHQQKYIYGTISDEENKPVSQALIEFEDKDTKKIVLEIYTNKAGRFYCRNNYAGEVNLLLSKTGYEVTTIPVNTLTLPERGLHLTLKKGTEHYHSSFAQVKEGISESAGVLFETSLMITIILELLFFSIYGFAKTTPYLALSIINILLWLFYVHEYNQTSSL